MCARERERVCVNTRELARGLNRKDSGCKQRRKLKGGKSWVALHAVVETRRTRGEITPKPPHFLRGGAVELETAVREGVRVVSVKGVGWPALVAGIEPRTLN